jgi:hypothetical protein
MIASGDFCGRDVRSVAHLLSGKQPTADQIARMRASTEQFLAHLIRPTTNFRPDIGLLRASPVRIVVGAGFTSKEQLANRAAVALATELGTDVVEFPGDHGGFLAHPDEFGHVLDQEQRAGASG